MGALYRHPLEQTDVYHTSTSSTNLPEVVPSAMAAISTPVAVYTPLFENDTLHESDYSATTTKTVPTNELSSASMPYAMGSQMVYTDDSHHQNRLRTGVVVARLTSAILKYERGQIFTQRQASPTPTMPITSFRRGGGGIREQYTFLTCNHPCGTMYH